MQYALVTYITSAAVFRSTLSETSGGWTQVALRTGKSNAATIGRQRGFSQLPVENWAQLLEAQSSASRQPRGESPASKEASAAAVEVDSLRAGGQIGSYPQEVQPLPAPGQPRKELQAREELRTPVLVALGAPGAPSENGSPS